MNFFDRDPILYGHVPDKITLERQTDRTSGLVRGGSHKGDGRIGWDKSASPFAKKWWMQTMEPQQYCMYCKDSWCSRRCFLGRRGRCLGPVRSSLREQGAGISRSRSDFARRHVPERNRCAAAALSAEGPVPTCAARRVFRHAEGPVRKGRPLLLCPTIGCTGSPPPDRNRHMIFYMGYRYWYMGGGFGYSA